MTAAAPACKAHEIALASAAASQLWANVCHSWCGGVRRRTQPCVRSRGRPGGCRCRLSGPSGPPTAREDRRGSSAVACGRTDRGHGRSWRQRRLRARRPLPRTRRMPWSRSTSFEASSAGTKRRPATSALRAPVSMKTRMMAASRLSSKEFRARRWRAHEAALEDRSPGALRSTAPEVASGLESSRCVAMAGPTIISYSSVVPQPELVESPVISRN